MPMMLEIGTIPLLIMILDPGDAIFFVKSGDKEFLHVKDQLTKEFVPPHLPLKDIHLRRNIRFPNPVEMD